MTISPREYSYRHRPFGLGCRALSPTPAFTLIELLAVVAIIGILAALLMPAISKGKLASLEAKSVSQLRLLQNGNIQYANDNNQTYVPLEDPVSQDLWLANPKFLKYCVPNGNTGWWGNSPTVIYSPLVSLQFSQSIGSSYGYNEDGAVWNPWPPPRRMDRDVPHPSQMMAFAESQAWVINQWGATNYKTPETVGNGGANATAYRYNGLTNVVYFDGHVGQLSMSQVADPNNWMLWRPQQ